MARVVEGKEVILTPMKYYSTMTCGGFIGTIVNEVRRSVARTISEAAAGRLDLWNAGPAVDLLPAMLS